MITLRNTVSRLGKCVVGSWVLWWRSNVLQEVSLIDSLLFSELMGLCYKQPST